MSQQDRPKDWDVCPELQDPSYVSNHLAQCDAQNKAVAEGCDFIYSIPDVKRFMELSTLLRQFKINFSTFMPTIPNYSFFIYLNRGEFTDKLLEAIGQVNEVRSNTNTKINQASSSDSTQEHTSNAFDFVAFEKLIDLLVNDYVSRTMVRNLIKILKSRRDLAPHELEILANLLNR